MRYSVKAAAIATGVSPSRLRTWERRYGIPSPDRSASGRRTYDEDDLRVIRRMAALVEAGVPASEAAETLKIEGVPPQAESPAQVRPEHPLVLELVDSCRAYDEPAVRRLLAAALEREGWENALDDIILPALHRIGLGWQKDDIVTANEHFASELIRREIACGSAVASGEAQPRRSVMLACAEDERHEIGLLSLGLLLRRRSVRVYYIGADVPAIDLLGAVRTTRVDGIVLAATMPSSLAGLERAARSFISSTPRVNLFVGGPAFHNGADASAVPGIHLPRRVTDAADLIAGTLSGDGREAA